MLDEQLKDLSGEGYRRDTETVQWVQKINVCNKRPALQPNNDRHLLILLTIRYVTEMYQRQSDEILSIKGTNAKLMGEPGLDNCL